MDFGKYIGGREDVMLDKRKIRLMTRAAIYEKNYGEEDFKISSYYKKDYSSLNTWVTLIWITVGYGLAAYVSLLIAYGIGAGSFYKNKHIKAKQRVKKYLRDLSRIEKINNKKEIN